jgi:ferric-dicitrate binding protein FerR (iron transport regulator)
MTRLENILWRRFLLLLAAMLLPCAALLQAGGDQSHEAGRITALLPEDHVLRAEETLPAAKDMALLWRDIVKTESGGRVRIELSDGSVLNIGSAAQLQILRHDASKQQTTLELLSGRLLADVVRIAKHKGKFEVRTPIATAGVVGTRFGVQANPDSADVLCREGAVKVRNSDPNISGEVVLHGGEFTHVERGKPPAPPAPASPEQFRAGVDATSIPSPP